MDCLGVVQAASGVKGGMNLVRALMWNCGNQSSRWLREKSKWLNHEGESTDARHWGGPTRTSVEGPVMGLEQRGWVRLLRFVVQLK